MQINRKGLGCIATQDIKSKTLILIEEDQIEMLRRYLKNLAFLTIYGKLLFLANTI